MELAQNIYLECHIILSSILRRKDRLDKKGVFMNNSLEKLLSPKKNVTFIRHPDIDANYHLKDKKNLDEIEQRDLLKTSSQHISESQPVVHTESNSNTPIPPRRQDTTITFHQVLNSTSPSSTYETTIHQQIFLNKNPKSSTHMTNNCQTPTYYHQSMQQPPTA